MEIGMSLDATAKLRFLRMSPRKVRLVADMVRGQQVNDALVTLRFASRFAAKPLEKLVKSAVANFTNLEGNEEANVDELIIKHLYVDEGPTAKRFRPRAQGRASRILKRSSHVTLVIGELSDGAVAETPVPSVQPVQGEEKED
jgi:large subunit ribosomal protein L22